MSHQSSHHPDVAEVATRTSPKKKARKPFEVWWRSTRTGLFREWTRYGRYTDEDIARSVVAGQHRKHPGLWEFEIRRT